MGQSTFIGCENLQYTVKDELKYLGNKDNPYLWLMGVESDEITQATIHMLCKRIGVAVFKDCTHLTDVVMPNSVAFMGHSVFANCSSLKNITLSKSLLTIPSACFHYCTELTSITIPDSVTVIDEGAFRSCSSLESVIMPNRLTSIGEKAFSLCTSLTNIKIPDMVTSIGKQAFSSCDNLESVIFSDTTTWYVTSDTQMWKNKTGGMKQDVTDSSANAESITFPISCWYKL